MGEALITRRGGENIFCGDATVKSFDANGYAYVSIPENLISAGHLYMLILSAKAVRDYEPYYEYDFITAFPFHCRTSGSINWFYTSSVRRRLDPSNNNSTEWAFSYGDPGETQTAKASNGVFTVTVKVGFGVSANRITKVNLCKILESEYFSN